MELVPQPLSTLLRRVEHEPRRTEGAVFDLPAAKSWKGTPKDLDLSRRFHGERSATTVGPAAGPHTQLAQNLALSYLAGARIMELKTVQILDELKIPRPCIDVTNIGFNVEWSQELKIEQSTIEYPKAALLIAALQKAGLPAGLDPEVDGDYLLDLSLGYDLKGVKHERVTGFVKSMLDARPILDRLRAELPKDLAHYRDLEVPTRLVSCVTLSTFHGCPAHEIESIARYLLEELGVHTVVKLNPTLLGYEAVNGILVDQLGYTDLTVQQHSFEHDLKWNDALAMIARLRKVAAAKGLVFGVKLTNTLVVKNHKTFFPATEKEMYLSGQPLHVLSTQLLAKLRRALPLFEDGAPPVEYSFSAGIDQHNFPLAAAADLCPVTTCTDLLRPGGYGRLPKYLDALEAAMRKIGAKDLESYTLHAYDEAEAALQAIVDPIRAELQRRGAPLSEAEAIKLRSAAKPTGHPRALLEAAGLSAATIELALPLWVHEAGTRNASHLAKAALADPRYAQPKNDKVPKKIGSHLELFDCVNCDKCVPVCPNDANFAYEVAPITAEAPKWIFDESGVRSEGSIKVEIEESHQLATYVDFCNGCGNCDVFCPEDGGPYVMKPHWFGSQASLEAEQHLDGFYLESDSKIAGRTRGRRVSLEAQGDRLRYRDGTIELEAKVEAGSVQLLGHRFLGAPTTHAVDSGEIVVLATLLQGVKATVNPVSAAFLDGTR
jgi:putative selenate reductase